MRSTFVASDSQIRASGTVLVISATLFIILMSLACLTATEWLVKSRKAQDVADLAAVAAANNYRADNDEAESCQIARRIAAQHDFSLSFCQLLARNTKQTGLISDDFTIQLAVQAEVANLSGVKISAKSAAGVAEQPGS